MSFRVKQINEQLLSELAAMVSEAALLKEGLITLTGVNTSPDLRYAKVFISVLPDKYSGTALTMLRKHNKDFSLALKNKLNIKFIPRLVWGIDEKIKYSLQIDEVLRQIREQDEEQD